MGNAQTAAVAHTPRYKRLTDEQRVAILKLASLGKTQVEIAQLFRCDQATISRWLSACEDSTTQATAFLRGQALRMSRNVVEKGKAADHIKALQGVGVLAQEQVSGVTIQIGIKDSDVLLDLGTGNITSVPVNALAQVTSSQPLTLSGSDKGSSVNPQDLP